MLPPKRKLPRLSNFDYSQNGCYFITICAHNRIHLFGKVIDASVQLNRFGLVARAEIAAIPSHYSWVSIDHSVVMPNHVHILMTIDNPSMSAQFPTIIDLENPEMPKHPERASPFPTVSTIIGSYKSGVTKNIHQFRPEMSIWQQSFYDHIIRDEKDYYSVCEYIENNPLKWEMDVLF